MIAQSIARSHLLTVTLVLVFCGGCAGRLCGRDRKLRETLACLSDYRVDPRPFAPYLRAEKDNISRHADLFYDDDGSAGRVPKDRPSPEAYVASSFYMWQDWTNAAYFYEYASQKRRFGPTLRMLCRVAAEIQRADLLVDFSEDEKEALGVLYDVCLLAASGETDAAAQQLVGWTVDIALDRVSDPFEWSSNCVLLMHVLRRGERVGELDSTVAALEKQYLYGYSLEQVLTHLQRGTVDLARMHLLPDLVEVYISAAETWKAGRQMDNAVFYARKSASLLTGLLAYGAPRPTHLQGIVLARIEEVERQAQLQSEGARVNRGGQ